MELSLLDRWLCGAETALRTLSGGARAQRPAPRAAPDAGGADAALDADERRLSGALMRVNHVGEVCAQALYQAQALATSDPALRARMAQAAREEIDHLAWTADRLAELGDRPSLLNPLWYGGAFLIGLAAGRLGDRASLGFVAETERQVEAHLAGHLDRLPARDAASRAIVGQMRIDEAAHARDAAEAGGTAPPAPVRAAMRAAARVMTTAAHRV
jgi:ubiquinone biosynthesis monooxygenase Coq7